MGKELNDIQIDQYISYWHGKTYLVDMWEQGYSPELAIEDLKDDNGKITWYK